MWSVPHRLSMVFIQLQCTRNARTREGGVGHWWWFFYASVQAKLFWCANPRPNPKYQSGSQSCRGLGRQDQRITREYNCATAISIWSLTWPRTCEMCSLSFSAMSWRKVANKTRSCFLSMPSNERIKGEKNCCCSW